MDNLDDTENAKVSDSAYSTSYSNSQSRRSHSSKSTNSGSHSSGSSGYGRGKPSATNYSAKSSDLAEPLEKRAKKTNDEPMVIEAKGESKISNVQSATIFEVPDEDNPNVSQTSDPQCVNSGAQIKSVDLSNNTDKPSTKEMGTYNNAVRVAPNQTPKLPPSGTTRANNNCSSDGFSCVVSMHDGVVMYTTSSITTALGFPCDMWIGRSFIDFLHPKDRDTFAAQITSVLASPKTSKDSEKKASAGATSISTMVSRIRKYRGISTGYGVKEVVVAFMPFLLQLSFKTVDDEEGNVIYLVIKANPLFSAFKIPNEPVTNPCPFIIRHSANGNLEYMDPEAIPYLGYLPQDMINKDALLLYHPEDLPYLRLVYKTIVKDGGMPRCKPYRMQAQNGDYVRVETEWLSFINPWSKKLEFITGKHFVIAGPSNYNVFDISDEAKSKEIEKSIEALRENIVRIMNEVLTKPAEVANQQMTKRCQDLASFMESLMEDTPKADEEIRLEIQDPDNSYFERDSVMLGGISPHHEYSDSRSSIGTKLSYNQLNYNETLHRYFESHEPNDTEGTRLQGDIATSTNTNAAATNNWFSKALPNSADTGSSEVVSTVNDSTFPAISAGSQRTQSADYKPLRLTESLMNKHNTEMEKELFKRHREHRSSTKGDREKSSDNYQKKMEHLARCNASFQPTTAELPINPEPQPQHGLKRPLKTSDSDGSTHKHLCTPLNQYRSRSTAVAPTYPNNDVETTSDMIHRNYAAAQPPSVMATPVDSSNDPNKHNPMYQPAGSSMVYGQAVYGQPFMYSPTNYPLQYNMQPTTDSSGRIDCMNALGLARSNYEEACKINLPVKSNITNSSFWRRKQRQESQNDSSDLGGTNSNSSKNMYIRRISGRQSFAMDKSAEAITEPSARNSQDKTDGESSYSSFYSSFFKTDSGSADDSDVKKSRVYNKANLDSKKGQFEPWTVKKVHKRKMEPPWLEQVCVTPNLIYKYQVQKKSMEEVLRSDKLKMKQFEQPSMVNEQLGQLYLDLQLEGVASRLTLEEGVTSSSSSGEESPFKAPKLRTKREYSKLVMIYEEDAPLPPPSPEPMEATPSTSTS